MERTKHTTPINPFGLPNIVIPAEVLFNPELSPRERILFGFINNLVANESGHCWASNRYLSRLIKVAPETISGMIAKLNKLDYITLEYEQRHDGVQIRKIFINRQYPEIYAEMVRKEHGKLVDPLRKNHRGVKPELKGAKCTAEPPLSSGLRKLDNKLDIELDNILPAPSGQGDVPEEKKKPNAQERNKQYLPLAECLSKIICSKKNIKHTRNQINSWTNDIRRLHEDNGIDPERIKSVLSWYQKNIGGQYIPVVESGSSLRIKFTKLEDAIERQGGQTTPGKPDKVPPKKQIKQAVPDKEVQTWLDIYEAAKAVLSNPNNGQLPDLAANIVRMRQQILDARRPFTGRRDTYYQQFPHWIVERYSDWLQNRDWLKDKKPNLFDTNHKLFREQFLPAYAQDNDDFDPITGQYFEG